MRPDWFERDPIILGGGSSGGGSTSSGIQTWTPGASYNDGQLVTLNGSLFQAIGQVPAGVVPPVEAASPLVPGSPRWRLVSRGKGSVEPYDGAKLYYQDARVTYNGIIFSLEVPSVAAGAGPLGNPLLWYPETGQMSAWESQPVTASNISGLASGATCTPLLLTNQEVSRVKSHRFTYYASSLIAASQQLALITFTQPHPLNRAPRISIQENTVSGVSAGVLASPMVNGNNQVTGYQLINQTAIGAGTTMILSVSCDEVVS